MKFFSDERYGNTGSKCKVSAGTVPCFLVAFWDASDEMAMFDLLTGIYDQIGNRCNARFHAQVGGLIARIDKALSCLDEKPDYDYDFGGSKPNSGAGELCEGEFFIFNHHREDFSDRFQTLEFLTPTLAE